MGGDKKREVAPRRGKIQKIFFYELLLRPLIAT